MPVPGLAFLMASMVCGKVGPSLAFEYTSHPGYRGPDSFGVRVRYDDREIRQARFEVEVY